MPADGIGYKDSGDFGMSPFLGSSRTSNVLDPCKDAMLLRYHCRSKCPIRT